MALKPVIGGFVQIPASGGGSVVPIVVTPSTDYEVPVPDGTPAAGTRVKHYITPTQVITLTVNAAIHVPTDSSFTAKVLADSHLTIVQLEYSGSFWMLETIIGGY